MQEEIFTSEDEFYRVLGKFHSDATMLFFLIASITQYSNGMDIFKKTFGNILKDFKNTYKCNGVFFEGIFDDLYYLLNARNDVSHGCIFWNEFKSNVGIYRESNSRVIFSEDNFIVAQKVLEHMIYFFREVYVKMGKGLPFLDAIKTNTVFIYEE